MWQKYTAPESDQRSSKMGFEARAGDGPDYRLGLYTEGGQAESLEIPRGRETTTPDRQSNVHDVQQAPTLEPLDRARGCTLARGYGTYGVRVYNEQRCDNLYL